jgi:hypothetical protein
MINIIFQSKQTKKEMPERRRRVNTGSLVITKVKRIISAAKVDRVKTRLPNTKGCEEIAN